MPNPEYRKALIQGTTKQPKQADDDRFLAQRKVLLTGPIGDDNAQVVVMKLLYLQSEGRHKPVELLINSVGGTVASSLAIIDTMHHVTCPVHTTCLGQAHGSAAVILASGEPGERRLYRSAQLSLVEVTTDSDADVAPVEVERASKVFREILAKATGRSEESMAITMMLNDRFDAQAAIDLGLADQIIDELAETV